MARKTIPISAGVRSKAYKIINAETGHLVDLVRTAKEVEKALGHFLSISMPGAKFEVEVAMMNELEFRKVADSVRLW